MLLDEALAAVAGSDVEDFCVLEEIFCQLFSACEHAHDVRRADQWIRVGEMIAERRRLPAVSAFCRTHYGGILTAAGRWPEADAALTEAVRLWGLGQKSLRGGALARLADLRVRQGRIEEAQQLLEGLDATTNPDVARPLAAIHLANGDSALARDVLERAFNKSSRSVRQQHRCLRCSSMFISTRTGIDDANSAARQARRLRGAFTPATIWRLLRPWHAGASVSPRAPATRRPAFARRWLGSPKRRCRWRLRTRVSAIANALLTERPEVAMAEARAALDEFDRLQAARHVDAAAAVLRSLGVRRSVKPRARRPTGLLSKREAEVLDLIGHGLSNPEISERLFISRKTVEHHVGNILSKLGLRSRGQAAAYSTRAKPGDQ